MPELWLHEVGNALTRPPNHSDWDAGDPPRLNLSNAFPSRGWLVLDSTRRSRTPLYEDAYPSAGNKGNDSPIRAIAFGFSRRQIAVFATISGRIWPCGDEFSTCRTI